MKLGPWPRRIFFVLAAIFFVFTFLHASWLAPTPRGAPKLIAHRAVGQPLLQQARTDDEACLAAQIEEPYHPFIEDSLRSISEVSRLGGHMAEINVLPTGDGDLVLFHDDDLACRTGVEGKVSNMSVEELKALDIAHGYRTADGDFPLRGEGVGRMPTLGEAFERLRGNTRYMFNLKSDDPAAADLLAKKIAGARRAVRGTDHAFIGRGPAIARLEELMPDSWVVDLDRAEACSDLYMRSGWFTIVPEACENGTLIVPLNKQWLFAGWPNRTIARMEEVGARIIVTGPQDGANGIHGLDLPEQFGEIPDSFNGYIWVDDLYILGPALRPGFNTRDEEERKALAEVIERRRESR